MRNGPVVVQNNGRLSLDTGNPYDGPAYTFCDCHISLVLFSIGSFCRTEEVLISAALFSGVKTNIGHASTDRFTFNWSAAQPSPSTVTSNARIRSSDNIHLGGGCKRGSRCNNECLFYSCVY